jgi:hypothetical protein
MFKIEVLMSGRWTAIGGRFATAEEAHRKIVEYLGSSVRKKTPSYRVVPAK